MEGHFRLLPSLIEDAEIAFISRRDFQAYCMEHPEVALKVLQVVGGRLRRLVGIIEELSFTTIRQRLISALLKLAQSEGKKTLSESSFNFRQPIRNWPISSEPYASWSPAISCACRQKDYWTLMRDRSSSRIWRV